jgi:hypothetical protein
MSRTSMSLIRNALVAGSQFGNDFAKNFYSRVEGRPAGARPAGVSWRQWMARKTILTMTPTMARAR